MYRTDSDTAKIQRTDLDGSNIEDLVTTGLQAPIGIALDVPWFVMVGIPALSEWGVVVMGLLLIGAGSIVIARTNRRACFLAGISGAFVLVEVNSSAIAQPAPIRIQNVGGGALRRDPGVVRYTDTCQQVIYGLTGE